MDQDIALHLNVKQQLCKNSNMSMHNGCQGYFRKDSTVHAREAGSQLKQIVRD